MINPENCNCRWESTPPSFVFDQMNKDCEKRAEILDRAILILRSMKKWETLAQEAMTETEPKKALELYEEARTEAIRTGDMKGDHDE